MARIIIPTPLRKFTDSQSTFDANGSTIKDAVSELIEQNPSLKPHILDKNDNIRSFIRVYLGDEDINALNGEATVVTNSSIISIVPAIAGGSY